jgi:hypothetical protein
MKADVRIPSLAGMRLQDKNTYNELYIPLRNQTAIGPSPMPVFHRMAFGLSMKVGLMAAIMISTS